MKLTKTFKDGIYRGPDGAIYRLAPVDRKYGKKGPMYYLERFDGEAMRYLTGLFKTQEPGKFSGDYRTESGRIFITVMIQQDGIDIQMQ